MSVFRRGSKRELFLGDEPVETEQQELQAKLLELHTLWSQRKDGSVKDMSLGVFKRELQVVEVVLSRGNVLQHMGFTWKGSLYIFLEEAVYLMDRGSMLLLDRAGKLVSFQEAFSLMVANGCSIERYLVYSHLMRSALYVRRHPAVWTIPKTVTPAQACRADAWQYLGPQQGASEAEGGGGGMASSVDAAEMAVTVLEEEDGEYSAVREGGHSHLVAVLEATSARRLLGRSEDDAGAPGGSENSSASKRRRHPSDCDKTSSRRWWSGLTEAHPWLLYSEEDATALPRCEVGQEVTTEHGAGQQLRCPIVAFPAINDAGDPLPTANLVFDIFKGNTQLRRKSPDSPLAHVCIASSPPSVSEARAAHASAGPRPALFALVEDGVVTLYQPAELNLSAGFASGRHAARR
mmetsp:Transcript_36086/g.102154  ORF Transcript_36086/g.102154 Transcript_36086/m.102154 type:complete len:406 (-) Transcript_36086:117-1334(-)